MRTKSWLLYLVAEKFANIDLHPATVRRLDRRGLDRVTRQSRARAG
jgi:hypothetical protein